MNVITVSRPARKRNRHHVPPLNRTRRLRWQRHKQEWQELVEVLLFAVFAFVSAWPVLAAFDAVTALK